MSHGTTGSPDSPSESKAVRKIVHFLRHAEGAQNVAGKVPGGYSLEENEDAHLTSFGVEQSMRLREKLVSNSEHPTQAAEIVICSPMRRALQTASIVFEHLADKIPLIGLECVREQTGLNPCARRMPISQQTVNFPIFDFSHVEHDIDALWHSYPGGREPEPHVVKRGSAFLQWLQEREEARVIVVTHASFLRMFFTQLLGVSVDVYQRFENCEMRSFSVEYTKDGPVVLPIDSLGEKDVAAENGLRSDVGLGTDVEGKQT